jgi:hypothetical protein
MAIILVRLLNLNISNASTTATFSDVPTTYLYFKQIEAIYKAHLTSGCFYDSQTNIRKFCPNDSMTRATFSVMLNQTTKLPNNGSDFQFTDISSSNYAYLSAQILVKNGVMNPCSNSPLKFCPDTIMTRGETALALAKYLLR